MLEQNDLSSHSLPFNRSNPVATPTNFSTFYAINLVSGKMLIKDLSSCFRQSST